MTSISPANDTAAARIAADALLRAVLVRFPGAVIVGVRVAAGVKPPPK